MIEEKEDGRRIQFINRCTALCIPRLWIFHLLPASDAKSLQCPRYRQAKVSHLLGSGKQIFENHVYTIKVNLHIFLSFSIASAIFLLHTASVDTITLEDKVQVVDQSHRCHLLLARCARLFGKFFVLRPCVNSYRLFLLLP